MRSEDGIAVLHSILRSMLMMRDDGMVIEFAIRDFVDSPYASY